jgi:Flp pilus assembly protein CpaB
MEAEFRENRARPKVIIAVGVVLALVAGGAAFVLLNQAQQQAASVGQQKVTVVVAIRAIPARQAIAAEDITMREVPLDDSNAAGVATDVKQVIGRIPAVTVLQGQLVTTNMLASSSEGGQFSILGPDESVTPESEAWRAVSLTVPDDLAVGGLLKAGQTVDIFVTTVVNVPQEVAVQGKYLTDRSTKITYQNVLILAREGAFYVIRASLPIAEEVAHLQAVGSATFSMALRPDTDLRTVDASVLGETTDRIIEKYGLPIPETYPTSKGPTAPGAFAAPGPATLPSASPTPAPSASPSP